MFYVIRTKMIKSYGRQALVPWLRKVCFFPVQSAYLCVFWYEATGIWLVNILLLPSPFRFPCPVYISSFPLLLCGEGH